MKKLIRSEFVGCHPASLQKEHTQNINIISERISVTFSKEVFKLCEHSFFQEILTKNIVTGILPVQSWFMKVNFLYGI